MISFDHYVGHHVQVPVQHSVFNVKVLVDTFNQQNIRISIIVTNLRLQLQVAFITQSYNCCRALLIVIAAGLSTASKQRANLLIKVTFFWKQAIAASAQKMHNITVTLGFYTPTSFVIRVPKTLDFFFYCLILTFYCSNQAFPFLNEHLILTVY